MGRYGLVLTAFVMFFLSQAAPASAEIRSISGGNGACSQDGANKCTGFVYPIVQGKTAVLEIRGPWLDWISGPLPISLVIIPPPTSGISAEITEREKISNVGRLKIRIVVSSNASLGEKVVTVSGSDAFKIRVLPPAKVTDVGVPTLNEFFTQVDVTVKGDRLKNSVVSNFSGDATDADVISTTEDEAQVRLKFPQSMAYAKARVVLRSPDGTTVKGLTDNSNTEIELVGPNAVKSISFPVSGSCGNGCFKVGDVFTVRIELVRPAKQGAVTKLGRTTSGGQTITYLMVPPGSFAEASPQAPYNSNGSFNTIKVAAGDTSTSFTLKVAGCPGPGQRPQVLIETWSDGNTNRKESPAYKSQSFTVSCQQ